MNVHNSVSLEIEKSIPKEIHGENRYANQSSRERAKNVPIIDVYSSIKKSITNNEFPINYQLNIRELGDRFGSSATPVREALIRLSVEDFIIAIPHKGFFTKIFRLDALSDRFEIASSILTFCIDKGLERVDAHLSEVMRLLEHTDESLDLLIKDPLSASSFIGDVLNAASSISSNVCAIEFMKTFNSHVHYIRSVDFEDTPTARSSVETALGILQGMSCQDVGRSTHHLDMLMNSALTRLPSIVREVNLRASFNNAYGI